MSCCRRLVVLAAVALLGGCTRPSDHQPRVQREIARRTGQEPTFKPDPLTVALPPEISLEGELAVDQAVALALWNNTGFQAALTGLGFARAEVFRAGQIANPTFSVLFPVGPKQLEFWAKFPLESFWLRPRRIAIAESESAAIAEALVGNGLDVVRDVKLACADLESARRQLEAQEEAVGHLAALARLTEAREQAGDISKLEVAQARAAAALARQDLIRFTSEATLAEQRLRALMGLASRNEPVRLSPLREPVDCALSVQELLDDAWAARPELRGAELALEAAGRRLGLAKAEMLALTAVLDANNVGNRLDVGPGIMDMTVPVFNQNQAGRALAHASIARASHDYAVVRDRIATEVRQAQARLVQAREEREAWRTTLPALESTSSRARQAYELGDVSLIASLEAAHQLAQARVREAVSVANHRRALAELERAVGHRLDAAFAARPMTALANPSLNP